MPLAPQKIESLSLIPDHGILRTLSQSEMASLCETSQNGLGKMLRQCIVAVLNTGAHCDSIEDLLSEYKDFRIEVVPQAGNIRLDLYDIPYNRHAFVDSDLKDGTREHIFAILRDLVFFSSEVGRTQAFNFSTPAGVTDSVFAMLRNANLIETIGEKDLVVIWGGHSIGHDEYQYAKKIGYELGLRTMDIGTGCGPGAMKAPMKGAAVGHLQQRNRVKHPTYLGMTETGIIAAEPPNPIVNKLITFPDIEKRLEGFVRRGHGIIIVPGGAGTAEEIFTLLGILLAPENAGIPFPVIFASSPESKYYFEMIHNVIGKILGGEAQQKYKMLSDPVNVAQEMNRGVKTVRDFRRQSGDHENFNWNLTIPPEFQEPFSPTHDNVAALNLNTDQPKHILAANLRKLFSAIVKGNIHPEMRKTIAEQGPFKIHAPAEVMEAIDTMLASFVQHGRMKIGGNYTPCYELVK